MDNSKSDKVLITKNGTYLEACGNVDVVKGSTTTVLEAYKPVNYKVTGYGWGFRVFRVKLDSVPFRENEYGVLLGRVNSTFIVGDLIEIDITYLQPL